MMMVHQAQRSPREGGEFTCVTEAGLRGDFCMKAELGYLEHRHLMPFAIPLEYPTWLPATRSEDL